MDLNTITTAQFQSYFSRDFPYLPTTPTEDSACNPLDYVLPADISKAFGEAQIVFNQSLFGSDAEITIAYLYLSAHYLCIDLRNALQGISSTGQLPVSARSVGPTSESYQIPQMYLDNPQLATYTTTAYGMKFLSLVLPNLVGNFGAVWGGTNP